MLYRPHLFVIYFIPELLADTVVLGLALWRAREMNVRMDEDYAWLWRELIRGNALYFFAMFVCNIATILTQLVRIASCYSFFRQRQLSLSACSADIQGS